MYHDWYNRMQYELVTFQLTTKSDIFCWRKCWRPSVRGQPKKSEKKKRGKEKGKKRNWRRKAKEVQASADVKCRLIETLMTAVTVSSSTWLAVLLRSIQPAWPPVPSIRHPSTHLSTPPTTQRRWWVPVKKCSLDWTHRPNSPLLFYFPHVPSWL